MRYEQAEAVARAWIAACEPRLQVDLARTITRPYGWVFLFAPAPGEEELTGGPGAILFDRVNGDVQVLGTGPLEDALIQYETSIPSARLTLKPELPPQGLHYGGFLGIIEPSQPIDAAVLRALHSRFTPPTQG